MLGGVSGAIPPPPANPAMLGGASGSAVPSIFQKAISNNVPGDGGVGRFDPLGWIAKGGGALNREVQKEAEDYAENLGRAAAKRGDYPDSLAGKAALVAPAAIPATLAEAAIPQNRLAAGLTLLGPAAKGLGMLKGALTAAPAAEGAAEASGNALARAGKVVAGEEVPAAAAAGARTVEGAAGAAEPLAAEAVAVPKGPPPTKPGFLAQLIQGRAGRNISLGTAQYAIDNPGVLDNAKSLEEANEAYANAVPGLKGKVQSLGQRLNKTVLDPGDYSNAINRAGRLLNGTPIKGDSSIVMGGGKPLLTPQDALEGVQTINKALRDKMYTSSLPPDQVHEVVALKDKLMDFLQNNGAPNMRAAARDLFEAHVKDAFSDWLPRNKFGTTDAMRTMTGMGQLGTAGAIAAAGAPGVAAPIAANALLSSPRVMGGVVKNLAAVPRAAATMMKAAPAAANLAGQEEPAAPTPAAPVVQSPGLISNILKSNVLNPGKSGTYAAEIKKLGLPSSMVSGSGKASITDLARLLHEAGAIPENDEGEAVQYLKGMAGRVK